MNKNAMTLFQDLVEKPASDCKTLPCRYSPAALRETHVSM